MVQSKMILVAELNTSHAPCLGALPFRKDGSNKREVLMGGKVRALRASSDTSNKVDSGTDHVITGTGHL